MATGGDNSGTMYADDFTLFQGCLDVATSALTLPSATAGGLDGYKCYIDVGAKITRVTDDTGGVILFDAGDTEDDLAIIGTQPLVKISDTAADAKRTVFECRVKLNTVAEGSVFIGLADNTMIADGGLIADDGGVIAAGDAIGFSVDEADVDGIDFCYQKTSAVEQRPMTAQVAAADTWYKLGFVYDPSAPQAKRIKVYVDNVEQSTYVTADNIAATTFPDGVDLGFVAASMAGDTPADNGLEVDWWALYQAN